MLVFFLTPLHVFEASMQNISFKNMLCHASLEFVTSRDVTVLLVSMGGDNGNHLPSGITIKTKPVNIESE